MKQLLSFLSSRRLAYVLAIAIGASILADYQIYLDAWNRWYEGEKGTLAGNQASAITEAIEQYLIDFPNAEPIANNRYWTDRLGGQNPKGVRYLKVERFQRDSLD